MRRREQFTGFEERSGKLNEAFLLGEVRTQDPEYQKVLKNLGGDSRGYLPFVTAMELAMLFQPVVKALNRETKREERRAQDPANPEKRFANDLRVQIADKLGLATFEELERLKYYTAIGSPLDFFHGVDAFVVLEGEHSSDPKKIVTFDFTLRTEAGAKENAKANVIIRNLDPDSQKALQQIDEIAGQAAVYLRKN